MARFTITNVSLKNIHRTDDIIVSKNRYQLEELFCIEKVASNSKYSILSQNTNPP